MEDKNYKDMTIEELRISIDETFILMAASMDKFADLAEKLNEKY